MGQGQPYSRNIKLSVITLDPVVVRHRFMETVRA